MVKDWTLFWTAFGAIGGTLGAFATAAAVCVALWQTKYANKKKVKLTYSDNIVVSNGQRFIGINVTNVGNRRVVINSWGVCFSDHSAMMLVPHIMDDEVTRKITTSLPKALEVEESCWLCFPRDILCKI